MDKFKQQIQQKLIANIILDKCARCEYLIFRDAWCTQERIIRFTTHFFRKLLFFEANESGKWKTGDAVMYEVHNNTNELAVNCLFCPFGVPTCATAEKNVLLRALGLQNTLLESEIVLKSWKLSRSDGDVNKLLESFDCLIEKEIPHFEQGLQEIINEEKPETPVLCEGALTSNILNKYERNQQARAACIAAHGTACSVCGLDFGKVYGPEFAGKIEVHHIVPLCEIGEEYVVDPINDLVPVCPNCHTALHSKPNGVYTIDELKKIRSQNHG